MHKILIVDDAKFMRVRCARILTENNYDVIEAENGIQAIEKYQSESPDAVLMDISMPEMDGLKRCGRFVNWTQAHGSPC